MVNDCKQDSGYSILYPGSNFPEITRYFFDNRHADRPTKLNCFNIFAYGFLIFFCKFFQPFPYRFIILSCHVKKDFKPQGQIVYHIRMYQNKYIKSSGYEKICLIYLNCKLTIRIPINGTFIHFTAVQSYSTRQSMHFYNLSMKLIFGLTPAFVKQQKPTLAYTRRSFLKRSPRSRFG